MVPSQAAPYGRRSPRAPWTISVADDHQGHLKTLRARTDRITPLPPSRGIMDAIPSVCLLNPAAQTTDTLYRILPVDTDTSFKPSLHLPDKVLPLDMIHPTSSPLSSPFALPFLHLSRADIPYTDALSLHQDPLTANNKPYSLRRDIL